MSVMANTDMNKATIQDGPPVDKPEKPSLVEMKNGKLVFKQKYLSFEKMSETMQDIVKFREMLEARLAAKDAPLNKVPDEHKPVIAKLVHESDKTLQTLSKHVQHELLPAVDEDEEEDTSTPGILPLDAVEEAIKSVAKRVNYGLESPLEGVKVPAAWLIWRWEVLDHCRDWLPKTAREKVDSRWKERQQVRSDVKALFDSLSEDERVTILGNKTNKATAKAKNRIKTIPGSGVIDLCDIVADASAPEPSGPVIQNNTPNTVDTIENVQDSSEKTSGRPKKPIDLEKAAEKEAKERERLEKKAAKAEREKKAQAAQAKSRSLMANFFGKTKSTVAPSPTKSTHKDGESGSPGPTTTRSDFQRTFRPFTLKRDAELAPINWFLNYKRRASKQLKLASRKEGNVIVIEDDEDEMTMDDAEPQDTEMMDVTDITTMTSRELLHDVLARLSPGFNAPRKPHQPTGYKTYNPLSVRGLMSQLTEAEVAGDDGEVRRLLAVLRDRDALPAKVLIFREDPRPGYFGTFTRSSYDIGPRAPFARDVVQVDYGYDSGEEWADEDAGEADDVVEDAEEDGDGDEDVDSDLDSWLVDEDEMEDPGTPIEERPGSPPFQSFNLVPSGGTSGKRKGKEEKERENNGGSKKRRVVVPLVSFAKGPEWEMTVGRCAYEPFKAYQIHLLNDTPFPIDPFTFVSKSMGHQQPSDSGPGPSQTADGFAIPALPPHVAKSSSSLPSSSSMDSTVSSAGNAKRATLTPKTTFPDAHLPHLFERIESLATSSLQGIVEVVHRELQDHKVKKNAIEAKIKEVGEKCKFRKVWVVKPDVKAQYGLSLS